jgi:eukaryotic-like serine/threonine-protein kinase
MRIGEVIDGRFLIEDKLGAGAMGDVFRALDRTTGARVAIKLLSGHHRRAKERFAREARILADLRHPAIVAYVAEGFASPDQPYLAMEWIDGHDLTRRLRQGRLPLDQCMSLLTTVAGALAFAHGRGVVHRDIKPSNLFLPAGSIDQVRLIDFGIGLTMTEIIDQPRLTAPGILVGTPGYMAPEQVRSSDCVGPGADMFSLGCVMFECLTGRRAFAGADHVAVCGKILFAELPRVSEFRDDVSPALERLIERMLAKDLMDRPGDGAALLAELEALGSSAGSAGSEDAASERPALSQGEQRIVSIVMARDLAASEVSSDAPTVPNTALRERGSALGDTVGELGGYLEQLSDGSLIMQMRGTGPATDAAASAARVALTIRERLPFMAIVLATGKGRADGRLPVGEVIDRAAELLRAEIEARPQVAVLTGPPAAAKRPAGKQSGPAGQPRRRAGIRLDELTAGLLDVRFALSGDASGLLLSGMREPLEVRRTLLGTPTPFVGRARELGNLVAMLEECIEDHVARAVVVTAAAGVGKTRLCAEFLDTLHGQRHGRLSGRDPVTLFMARGEMVGSGSSFALLAQGLRRALGIQEGEPLVVRRKKLHVQLAPHFEGAELDRVATFLGELIGTRFADPPGAMLRDALQDARLMGDQLRRAWQDWVSRQCAETPLLIVLEDLHWGDHPTVKAVDETLRNLKDRPLMVLALARPEVHERFASLWSKRAVEHIWLSELSPRASERLAQSVLGRAVDQDTIARVVEQSAGNAFYLEELIRAAAEGRLEAPETVLAMVQARLDKLPAESRRILRAAAVFGETFWLGGVLELLGQDASLERLRERLAALVEGEFVQRSSVSRFDGQEQYVFSHAMVREATYITLTLRDRQLGHRLAGRWLEQRGETDAMVLAEHFEQGGEKARAVTWYVRATQQALESDDLDDVPARAQRAVDCGATGVALGELRLAQAEALNWQGSFQPALPYAIETVQLFSPHTDLWYRAVCELAVASWRLGQREPLLPVADELMSVPEPDVISAPYVRTLSLIGLALLDLGDFERLAALRRIITRSRARADDLFRPWADFFLQVEGKATVEAEIAARLTALQAVREAGNRRRCCVTSINLGCLWTNAGVYSRAESVLREALAEAESIGLHQLTAHARNNLGYCLARLGKLDEAIEIEERAVEDYRELGLRRLEAGSRSYLAYIYLQADHLDSAEVQARAAVELTDSMPRLRCLALANLAICLLGAHRVAEALEVSGQAMDILAEFDNNVEEGEVAARLAHAQALHACGFVDDACAAITSARDRLLEQARTITNPRLMWCFLYNVAEHARTLSLAEEWTGVPTPEIQGATATDINMEDFGGLADLSVEPATV